MVEVVQAKRAAEPGTAADKEIKNEFGGPIGATILMIVPPFLMLYFWACLERNGGHLGLPLEQAWTVVSEDGFSWRGTLIYLGFNALQFVLAATMPGPIVNGLPLPSEDGRCRQYHCNGVSSWYVTLVLAIVLHESGLFPLPLIVDNIGPMMTTAIIWGILVSIVAYFAAVFTGTCHRMSGNFAYDFFMGASLNPSLGSVDLKMWSEIRIPWMILFFISLSAAAKEYEAAGSVSSPLIFMVLAHGLYVNACMKGEECIPATWDIFYEKWGFMLIFWNLAGVPFSYCYSTIYLLKKSLHGTPIQHHPLYTMFCFSLLLVGYYIWDTANSQKTRFRMMQVGTYLKRSTFPQLPWGTLRNPKFIKTANGGTILVDGWWAMARKLHYTADLLMALSWGLIAGFGAFLPYFYFFFFVAVLAHRAARDMERCAKKYGEDWNKYCKAVPYVFIPGVI